MAKITWDNVGERIYETGVDRGVLFVYDSALKTYKTGVAWNGLISVSESPSGAEPNPQYADNIKYLNLISQEEFGASVEAFTYPDEFAACEGSVEAAGGLAVNQQTRAMFGLCYRTLVGSDSDGTDHGYKLHIIYNALAAPTDRTYTTINESPEAMTFSWEITTTPVPVTGFKPTACVVIDSTEASEETLTALENVLYGEGDEDSRLPLPDEVITIMTPAAG